MPYQPPFSLTDTIVSLVAEIAQKVGRAEAYEQLDRSPKLRKENHIKTIHSSCTNGIGSLDGYPSRHSLRRGRMNTTALSPVRTHRPTARTSSSSCCG